MACSRKNNCELFPLISINGALKIWQSFYCDGNYQSCVRYQLGIEGKSIPASLLPNGKNLNLGITDKEKTPDENDEETIDQDSTQTKLTQEEQAEPGKG